jgi:hypothetical protein
MISFGARFKTAMTNTSNDNKPKTYLLIKMRCRSKEYGEGRCCTVRVTVSESPATN